MNVVDNIAGVLRLFTPERGVLSVTEVAQLLRLPKSSSSRLLKAMAEAGLLANADGAAGYAVGNLIFETSRRHRVNSTLSLMADEALMRIVKATGHTGYVAMLDGTVVLGLRMRPGNKPLRVVTSPGDRLPAFCSSTGRALLARLDDPRAVHGTAGTTLPQRSPDNGRPAGRTCHCPRQRLVDGNGREPSRRRIDRRLHRRPRRV
jgi:IclR family KDG regulon transcriptional repressor